VAGIGLQPLAQELFGLLWIAEMRAQPIRSDYEGSGPLWIKLGSELSTRGSNSRASP